MSDLVLESPAKSGGMRRPDFFIVGAPKCGTTALCRYLARTPEIYMCPLKEAHFFGADVATAVSVRDKEEYLALFADMQDEKRAGESSVWYLYSKRAAAEIKEFSPAASIIIMLRNPVDVMHALHSQLLYAGREEIEDFEAALDAESDRKRGLRIPRTATLKDHFFYRECVAYTEQIRRYVDVFGWKNLRILIFDDFIADTARLYRDTCEFLGVTAPADLRFEVVNANKRVRSKRLRSMLDDPPQVLRKLGRPFITRGLRHSALSRLRQLNTKYEPRRPLKPELRRRLQAEALPEVERLSNFLGRDLTGWCRS